MNPALHTAVPDIREVFARFVLQLFDGSTGGTVPAGELTARLTPALKGKRFKPVQKYPDATFVCVGLPPGDYTIEVRSNEDTRPPVPPYYFARNFPFTVPEPASLPPPDPTQRPVWPGLPDISLSDERYPLDDPRQDARYLAQRRSTTLQPTVAYPFPPDATLVRGTVLDAANEPVAEATVEWAAGGQSIVTDADGQFVIFLPDFPKPPRIALTATHASLSTTKNIDVRRGMTVAANLQLT